MRAKELPVVICVCLASCSNPNAYLPDASIVIDSRFRDESLFAYRLDPNDGNETYRRGRNDEAYLYGWQILEIKPIESEDMQNRIRQVLSDKENYGGDTPDCFWPGIGFRFGESNESPAAVICLKCDQVYFFDDGEKEEETLSKRGVAQLRDVYNELFAK